MTMSDSIETLRQQVHALQRENLSLRVEQTPSTLSATESGVAQHISTTVNSWIERLVSSTTAEALGGFRDHTTAVALQEALQKLRELTEHATSREHEVLIPLREKYASLLAENEQLKHKIVMLQASESTRDAQNTVELEQSREVISSYKVQLSAMQKLAAESAGPISSVIAESSAAKLQAVEYAARIASLEAEVTVLQQCLAEKEASIAAVIDQERSKCLVLQEQLAQQQQQGLQILAGLKVHGEELNKQLVALSEENLSLRGKLEAANTKAQEDSHHVQDHRAAILANVDPSSMRSQVVSFWFTGHEEIEMLKHRVAELESAEQRLPILQRDVVGMKRSRSIIVENITTLSTEVERLRAEETSAKVKCAGLEAENRALVIQLATLLNGHLSQQDIASCGAAIRKAAADAAAATTVVLDPVAAQRARNQALELKNEVLYLGRQKDVLLKIIASREERICALNAIVASKAVSTITTPVDVPSLVEHVLNTALVGDLETDEQWSRRRAALFIELEAAKAQSAQYHQLSLLLKAQLDDASSQVLRLTATHDESIAESTLLHERMRLELTALTQINAKLVNENARMRTSHNQSCLLLQRLHEHHVSLYQFATSQAAQISSLYDKIQSLHTNLRTALAQSDMSVGAEDAMSDKILLELEQHLSSLKDAIEEDKLKRTAWESSTALQLAADVDKRDELLRKFQDAYSHGLKENSAALVTLIQDVRQAWDAKLNEQRTLLEKERLTLQSRNHHEDVVLRTLSQAMLKVPATGITANPPSSLKIDTSRSPVSDAVSHALAASENEPFTAPRETEAPHEAHDEQNQCGDEEIEHGEVAVEQE